MAMTSKERIYLPPQWHEDIELLAHVGRYSNTLLLVNGISGSGKTTLMHAVQDQLHGDCQLTTFAAREELQDVQTLCQILSQRFHLSSQTLLKISLPQQAKLILQGLGHTQQNYVVCIDDAHHLPDEVLELILFFIEQQQTKSVCLHFILFAEPSLTARLMRVSLSQQLEQCIHHLDLLPLTYAEIEHYLRFYFVNEYELSSLEYNKRQLEKLYKQSQGYIGLFKPLAEKFFLERKTIAGFTRSANWSSRALGGGVVVAALVLAAYGLNSLVQSIIGDQETVIVQKTIQPEPETQDINFARTLAPLAIEPVERYASWLQPQDYQIKIAYPVQKTGYYQQFLTSYEMTKTPRYLLKSLLLEPPVNV